MLHPVSTKMSRHGQFDWSTLAFRGGCSKAISNSDTIVPFLPCGPQ